MTADLSARDENQTVRSPWIMIPARGGSRRLPRKNVRLLHGVPLLVHAVRAALAAAAPDRVVVVTDDDEIAAIATRHGVRVLREPPTTGHATLDDVACKVLETILEGGAAVDDAFLTLQPTCPFVRPERLREAAAALAGGAGAVLTVVDDRHLGWTLAPDGTPRPDYARRVNRQELPPHFRESGAVIGTTVQRLRVHRTRIVEPIHLIEVEADEALDIDTFSDWVVAEHLVSRRRVLIRADADEALGMGHVYRALAVAQELARHAPTLATDAGRPLGRRFFEAYPFALREIDGDAGFLAFVRETRPDLIVLDQLDTAQDYVRTLKAAAGAVVTFEDLGPGAAEADLVISDLYENLAVPTERQLTGIANAVLAPNFETSPEPAPFRPTVEHVLVLFGGTDPSGLATKTFDALARLDFAGTVTVIRGLGAEPLPPLASWGLDGEILVDVRHMPGVISRADMAISSAGRTITELVSLGVPTLCLCQNEKELTHTHASAGQGVVNLGLGRLLDTGSLAAHIAHLLHAPTLRKTLRDRALHASARRSNAAVIERIAHAIGWTCSGSTPPAPSLRPVGRRP